MAVAAASLYALNASPAMSILISSIGILAVTLFLIVSWQHSRASRASANGGTDIDDEVVYSLPFGLAGRMVAPLIRLQLARIFSYRTSEVLRLLHAPAARS